MPEFVHLHSHSEHSALDGMATTKKYVHRAKEMGQPALALSDHGVLSGLPVFYRQCKDAGIEPVLGVEAYFTPRIIKTETRLNDKGEEVTVKLKKPDFNHIVLLARGEKGYRVLVDLMTEAHKRYWYKPLLDRDVLAGLGPLASHVTVLSGCLAGPMSRAAQIGQDALMDELSWWQKHFPHLYLELQDHGIDDDWLVNRRLAWASRQTGVPIVITNDPHYTECADAGFHDALLAVQTASDINDEKRFRFDGEGYWLKSAAEMQESFARYPRWVWEQGNRNGVTVAKECTGTIPEWETRVWQVPEIPGISDPNRKLEALVAKAIKEKGLGPDYVRQARHEVDVIRRMGVAGFILVAWDAVAFAKSRGILVGPGRGSGVGSLVCYLLGITRIDPLKYGLRFDRFLNPERPRMPDIDIDFAASRRDEMFDYVRDRYGAGNVMNVGTQTTMQVKRAFRSLAKSHGIPFAEANEISKGLVDPDEDSGDTLDDHIPSDLAARYPDLVAQLEALRGLRCGFGAHPSGVVIVSPSYDLHSHVPQMWLPRSERFVAQYDLEALEVMGLMKSDFLGLTTLEAIDECLSMIEEPGVNPEEWEPDEMPWDPEVYKMLAEGKTGGIFQLKGPSNSEGARDIGISCFKDIIDCLALYRKGPIQAGDKNTYLRNRRNGSTALPEALEPILGPTYGALAYQEQILELGEHVAGFGPGPNTDLLQAVAKKKQDLMASIEPAFIEGCVGRGLSEKAATLLWKRIKENAWYAFNKSHSAAYARTAYEMAVLKYRFPLEYYCALLRTEKTDKEGKRRRYRYKQEASAMGIEILRPDVNLSGAKTSPDRERNAIRCGLTEISGVGDAAAKKILGARGEGYETASAVELIVRNSKVYSHLVAAGGLECLGIPADDDRDMELLNWLFTDKMKDLRDSLASSYKPPTRICGEIIQIHKGQTKEKKPFCNWIVRWSPAAEHQVKLWSEAESLFGLKEGSIVQVTGRWEPRWSNTVVNSPKGIRIIRKA